MVEVFLCLGSNVDREKNIAAALNAIGNQLGQLVLSPLYESQAIDGVSENYFNMAVGLVTDLSLQELKQTLKKIEDELGRDRNKRKEVSIDIDIAIFGDTVETIESSQGRGQLPHPDILKRAHVLLPLSEIVGDYVHPETQRTLKDHAHDCDKLLAIKA